MTRRDVLKASIGAAVTGMASAAHAGKAVARIGLVTDLHYAGVEVRGRRYYRQSAGKLQECIDVMNREAVDALVEIGDFKDQDDPAVESNTLDYLQTIESEFRRFRGPRYHVLGNHDLDSLSKTQFQAVVANTGIPADRTWYSFDVGRIHCVVLDANFSDKGVPHDHNNFDWRDAFVPDEQLAWLRRDLAEAALPTIVFVHQLLDRESDHAVSNAAEVRFVLESSGKVLAAFHGHYHAGDYSYIKGIHYYTLRAVVEESGPENSAYAIADVAANGDITVTGYRRAVSKVM